MRSAALLSVVLGTIVVPATAASPEDVFRVANAHARSGDYPKACVMYQQLAGSAPDSASLYWNWAQVAAARGAAGESLWALLRAREADPWDPAVAREIERVREGLNLDAAEIEPEPLAALARGVRPLRLEWSVLVLLLVSLLSQTCAQVARDARWKTRSRWAAWGILGLALALFGLSALAVTASSTGVVVRRNAPLLEAASATASPVGVLREGEVLPIRGQSGEYLKVQDSSGARGWVASGDLRRLDQRPLD